MNDKDQERTRQDDDTASSQEASSKKRPRHEPVTPPLMLSAFWMENLSVNLLQDPDTAGECLLRLARTFRQQSALCLQQADRLDRMAMDQEQTDDVPQFSRERLPTRWKRQNVVSLVEKSSEIMLQSHQMMDSIESRLVPWNQKIETLVRPKQNKGGLTAYNLFLKDNFDSYADRLGTRSIKVVSVEIGKAWQSISLEEKRRYEERLKEIKRQNQQEEHPDVQDDQES